MSKRYLKDRGFDSHLAQDMANKFQPWHKIRTDPTSLGHKLLNAFSMGLGEMKQDMLHQRKNLFIGTADTLTRWEAWRTEVPQNIELRPNPGQNMLINADLVAFGPAYLHWPLDWTLTNAIHYQDNSPEGNGCVKMTIPAGETGEFIQSVDLLFNSGEDLVGSIYLYAPGTGEANLDLILEGKIYGSTIQSSTASTPAGTSNAWSRNQVVLALTGECNEIVYTARCINPTTGEIVVSLGAPQLEFGLSPTSWRPYLADSATSEFRLSMVGPTGEEQRRVELRERLYSVDVFEDALPTRATTASGIVGEVISSSTAPTKIDFDESVWLCAFRPNGECIERYNRSITHEVFNTYTLLDRYPDNEVATGEYGDLHDDGVLTREVEALTTHREMVWAIVKDTYNAITTRTLKVVRWVGKDSQMQILADIPLDIHTGTVSSIGFIEGDRQKLGMEMSDDSQWTINLSFDYFLFDNDRRQAIVVHPYSSLTPTFTEF